MTKILTNKGNVDITQLNESHKIKRVCPHRNCKISTPRQPIKIDYNDFPYYIITTKNKSYEIPIYSKIKCSFNETFNEKYLVYLMNVNDLWRIGKTSVTTKNGTASHKQTGLSRRVLKQKPDKVWILGVYDDEQTAYFYEDLYSLQYRIPQHEFLLERHNSIENKRLLKLSNYFNFFEYAQELLTNNNQLIECPLWEQNGHRFPVFKSNANAFITPSNLIPHHSTIYDINFDTPQLILSKKLIKKPKTFCIFDDKILIINNLIMKSKNYD